MVKPNELAEICKTGHEAIVSVSHALDQKSKINNANIFATRDFVVPSWDPTLVWIVVDRQTAVAVMAIFEVAPEVAYGLVFCAVLADLMYCCIALVFLAGWRERPKISTSLWALTSRIAVWGSVAWGTTWAVEKNLPALLILVIHPFALLFSFHNIRQVRRDIVEGGPAPPIILAAAASSSSPTNRPSRQPRVVIITGANAGIGKETALWYAQHYKDENVQIFLLCRNTSKGQEVVDEAVKAAAATPRGGVVRMRVIPCDLTSFESVRTCVNEIKSLLLSSSSSSNVGGGGTIIDTLILNAGVMLKDCEYTQEDDHEMTLQANHLGHFLLTALLLPLMVRGNNGSNVRKQYTRIICLTSSTFPLCRPENMPYDDPQTLDEYLQCRPSTSTNHNNQRQRQRQQHSYGLFTQYAKSKWCNILHAYQLSSSNCGIWSAAVHPGLVRTDVVKNMPCYMKLGNDVFAYFLAALQKTPSQGAWGTIHAAHVEIDDTNNNSGRYWENRAVVPLDEELLQRAAKPIWEWSCQAVRLTPSEREALEWCKKQS
jgi:NAD(P)-dependent dehydrogenase (short-subunit alcohol dehydrogenase family)